MQFREIQQFTRQTIKGRYMAAFTASLLYPALWLLLKLVPCFLAAVLLACRIMTPRELFLGSLPLWVCGSLLWELLSFCLLTPVKCGVCSWLTDVLGFDSGGENIFFRSFGAYCRGIAFFAGTALCRLLALLPFVLSAAGAVLSFRNSLSAEDGGLWLFLCIQSLCAAVWTGVFYLRFCVGMAAVPFLYLSDPKGSPFLAVRQSQRMLSGRHRALWGMLLRYVPVMASVVTIPFLLPYFTMNCALFLQIRIHEWAQHQEESNHARTAISYGTPGAMYAGELPAS